MCASTDDVLSTGSAEKWCLQTGRIRDVVEIPQSRIATTTSRPPVRDIRDTVNPLGALTNQRCSLATGCGIIRLIVVCADRDQPEFLCSRSDSRYLGVHVATAGGCQRLLTHYRRREVTNSVYRYRKSISIIDRNFHIDSYRLYW